MTVPHLLRNAALLLAAACAASLANGAPTASGEQPASTCEFGAFVAETDPAGLNVRAAPNATARILGKLPPTFVDPSMEFPIHVRVEVDVVGAHNGWFLIRNAQDNEMLTDRPARPMFTGEGWVSGSKLVVKSQADVGRARPGPQAPALLRYHDDDTFDNDVAVAAARLVDCKGRWAQVEFADHRLPAETRRSLKIDPAARVGLAPGRFRVWFDRICANQETSCDGLALPEAAP